MPHIYVCFLWHMHQPFYKDLVTGEYKLPWTRMHALKDYYGMVKVLEDFPDIHQTFNLVPSMLAQIEEYASGAAVDPFLKVALRPAEELTPAEQEFILHYFFQANPSRMIYRYPRYGELFDAWQSSGRTWARARRVFDAAAFRDLQVLSQLAWFDEEFLTKDPVIAALVRKGRKFTAEDQRTLGRKQIDVIGKVIPVYREFASRGQIELSTTPYYHPILPLLCDSNIAEVAHPYVALPPRFQYPQDAAEQLERARVYMQDKLGTSPAGLWPSEGSVSDEVLHLAAETGFRWFATDNGVLGRTLNRNPDPSLVYRPYLWTQGEDRDSWSVPRSLPERPCWIRIFTDESRRSSRSFPESNPGKFAADCSAGVRTRSFRSSSMEKTRGNTTKKAAARFCASYTDASPTTVKCRRLRSPRHCSVCLRVK